MTKKSTTDKNQILEGEKDTHRDHQQLSEAEKLMPELRTLAYCSTKAVGDGFTENFKAVNGGLKSMETEKMYTPDQLDVVNFYRFEGITDPADMSVLYIIETNDGARGTLVDAYGTYADFEVAKVIREIESIAKKKSSKHTTAL